MTVIRHPNNQGVTLSQWRKTAAGGETSLSGTDDFSAGLAYTVGAEEVFVNGVLIERGVDYTATSGTSVTLTNALVAGDLATVSSPSSFQVANAIPKNTITAKGDLIVATGASTPANLAVGADGTTLVADSSTSTGLRYTAGTVQANPVLNSAFQIAQRGTSIAIGTGAPYTLDRWQGFRSGATAGETVSQQATADATNLPFIQKCARVQRDSGNTSTATLIFSQSFETVNTIPFVGKTVTLSFYARKGANFSQASSAILDTIYTGTGTDQSWIIGYTGFAVAVQESKILTTTWQRFTTTVALGTSVNELSISFAYDPTGTAGAADYFEVTGVQLDIGSVALPFRTNSGTLQGELAACQRYFYNMVSGNSLAIGNGTYFNSSNLIGITVRYPVFMRVAPTLVNTYGTNYYAAEGNGGTDYLDTFSFRRASISTGELYNNSEASGTTGFGAGIITNNASSSISFNAEL